VLAGSSVVHEISAPIADGVTEMPVMAGGVTSGGR
jgi:hypothetical protein